MVTGPAAGSAPSPAAERAARFGTLAGGPGRMQRPDGGGTSPGSGACRPGWPGPEGKRHGPRSSSGEWARRSRGPLPPDRACRNPTDGSGISRSHPRSMTRVLSQAAGPVRGPAANRMLRRARRDGGARRPAIFPPRVMAGHTLRLGRSGSGWGGAGALNRLPQVGAARRTRGGDYSPDPDAVGWILLERGSCGLRKSARPRGGAGGAVRCECGRWALAGKDRPPAFPGQGLLNRSLPPAGSKGTSRRGLCSRP